MVWCLCPCKAYSPRGTVYISFVLSTLGYLIASGFAFESQSPPAKFGSLLHVEENGEETHLNCFYFKPAHDSQQNADFLAYGEQFPCVKHSIIWAEH